MKKILLIVSVLLVINVSAFAKGGFEAIINVPVGMSIGIDSSNPNNDVGKQIGLDSGANVKLGYMFIFNKWSFSILGELGYSYDTYKTFKSSSTVDQSFATIKTDVTDSLYVHSIHIGVLPKFNFKAFSLGIGIGGKIPVALSHNNKTSINGTETSYTEKLSGDAMDKLLKNSFIPYVKVTFEYSIYFNNNVALNIGAYIANDFNIGKEFKIDKWGYVSEAQISTIDLGLQFGLRFAPKYW